MTDEKFQRLLTSLFHAVRITHGGLVNTECPWCSDAKQLPVLRLTSLMICKCASCEKYVLPFAGALVPIDETVIKTRDADAIKEAVILGLCRTFHQFARRLVEGHAERPEGLLLPDEVPNSIEDLFGDDQAI